MVPPLTVNSTFPQLRAATGPQPQPVSPALAQRLQSGEPFALIRHENHDYLDVYFGPVCEVSQLADIALRGPEHRGPDVLVAVPFAQVRERGFAAHHQQTPLAYLQVQQHHRVPLADFTASFPPHPVQLEQAEYDLDDQQYAQMVQHIIDEQIGQGEGANFVIRRTLTGRLPGWNVEMGLGLLSRLLETERGAYATFAFNLGQRLLLGASPERHVSYQAGQVLMNPISGTYRFPTQPTSREEITTQLQAFLEDEKEILELMMVVDEELKMMAALCPEGGQIIGPRMKQMRHLVHTEYLLQGRSELPPLELLRGSMFAATVVGSPVENACRVIAEYETSDRGYYGAVLAEIGCEDFGPTLEAPILIRTADISAVGQVQVSVGATLVRDSQPEAEVAETRVKARGLLAALGASDSPTPAPTWPEVQELIAPESRLLTGRNTRLSPFWMQQSPNLEQPEFAGRTAILVTAGDDFANMLAHMLRRLGLQLQLCSWQQAQSAAPADADLLVMGPGPGDPREPNSPRLAIGRGLIHERLQKAQPLLAVCLGHQLLAQALGFRLARQKLVAQGTQREVVAFGQPRLVGFYNTFTALDDGNGPADCRVWAQDGEIVSLAGPHYAGMQFHPESVLTQAGPQVLTDALRAVFTPAS